MSEGRVGRLAVGEPNEDRVRLFRYIAGISTIGAVAALLILTGLGLAGVTTPLLLLGPPVGGFILGELAAFWLSRSGRHDAAVLLHIVALSGALYVVIHFANGSTGPLAIVLVAVPILAGLFAGRQAVFWTALITILLQAGLFVLEYWGVLPTQDLLGAALPWVDLGTLLTVVVIMASIVSAYAEQVRRALLLAQQRGEELGAATQRAEAAARAEREARVREEAALQQLREAVQRFAAFLARVSAGDYAARFPVEELSGDASGTADLRDLGTRLNATVETLTDALTQMRVLQDRYAREAWTAFTRSSRSPVGARYQDGLSRPEGESWLPLMSRAMDTGALAVEGVELALPIKLGGEVIGVLGAVRRRGAGDGAAAWADEELVVIEAAVDQLAQTLEALRLLDRMQQSAAREQLTLQISEQVRGAMDIEEILRLVSHALGRELGASEVVVRLGTERTLLEGERT